MVSASDPILGKWLNEKARLTRQIERAEMQIAEAKERLGRIEIAIEEYEIVTGSVASRSATARTDRVDQMVLDIVRRVAPDSLDAHAVVEILMKEGWTTQSTDPTMLIQTYLSRLKQAGHLERVEKGRYAAAPDYSGGSTEAEPPEHLSSRQEGGEHHATPLDDR